MSKDMEKKVKELLSSDVIGDVVLKDMSRSRFPHTYHYDIARNILTDQDLSRGETSQLFKESVVEEFREEEAIKGALAYLYHYNKEEILEEVLNTTDGRIIDFYRELKDYVQTLWVYSLKNEEV